MIMPGPGTHVYCPTHGDQTSFGCMIQCPVCEHIEFLERYYPDDVEEFKKTWQDSEYNKPFRDGFEEYEF